MSKVITFSRFFPKYHPKAGQPTNFVRKIWKGMYDSELASTSRIAEMSRQSGLEDLGDIYKVRTFLGNDEPPKFHTIREGNRWKVGDKFSPRVWSGKPYNSKQIIIAHDIEVKKVWQFEISEGSYSLNGDKYVCNSLDVANERICKIAANDGLLLQDFINWFPEKVTGQIICWNETIEYLPPPPLTPKINYFAFPGISK